MQERLGGENPKDSQPEIKETESGILLHKIYSDDESPYELVMQTLNKAMGDVFVTMFPTKYDPNIITTLPTIRFRGWIGGGLNPFIAEELNSIILSFMEKADDSTVDEYKYLNNELDYLDDDDDIDLFADEKDRINSRSKLKVERFDANSYKIIDMQDDDEILSEAEKFLDLEVTKEGNVILTERHVWSESEIHEGKMLFKSEENGGKYPEINRIFRKLGDRILNAEDPRRR